MSRRKLTAKQHAFLEYIKEYVREHSIWPTYREIIEEFGYQSPNSVTQNLQALYKKNYLRRNQDGYHLIEQDTGESHGIPIRGIIAAGQLQEAVEANLGAITLESLFPNLDRIFAIRVSGQSMQGADIHDGDYVLLIDDDIPNGGIGAVLYNGETSLKRIYSDEDGLRLEPANPAYDNIYIEPDIFEEVRVLGRYVGHVNRNGIYKRTITRSAA
ncbi:MAG: LexA family protein [Rhodothermales bacterium]